MVTRTWEERELRLLEVIAQGEDGPSFALPSSDDATERTGLDPQTAQTALRALYRADYITGSKVNTHSGWGLLSIRLTERGRRAVGQWPSENAL